MTFLPVLAVQYRWRYCVILDAWAPSAVPAMPVGERFYLGDSLSVGILSSCPVRAGTAFARGGAFSSVHVCIFFSGSTISCLFFVKIYTMLDDKSAQKGTSGCEIFI